MVVAYLRGLLKPSFDHGLRSIVAENYVLDTLVADTQARMLEATILSDSAILPALTMDAKKDTMRLIRKRMQRCVDIRNGEIYGKPKVRQSAPGQISLYQLYQLATKSGILETLAAPRVTDSNGPV
jgi:septation ring formation regulator EzrA